MNWTVLLATSATSGARHPFARATGLPFRACKGGAPPWAAERPDVA